jgi:hypothetical protein
MSASDLMQWFVVHVVTVVSLATSGMGCNEGIPHIVVEGWRSWLYNLPNNRFNCQDLPLVGLVY